MIPSLGYMGADQLDAALQGCQVVVIPAGVPRKPGTVLLQMGNHLISRCIHNRLEFHFEMK